MQIVRFRNDRNVKMYGILKNKTIRAIDGDIFNIHKDTGIDISLDKIKLLAPIPHPNKIIGIGLNYKEHVKEWANLNKKSIDDVMPKNPIIFLKPPTSRIGHKGEIEIPAQDDNIECEGELAIIIGRECRNVSTEKSLQYVLGYTCANDVTARTIQREDGQWTRAKGFDTFCPLGPAITIQEGFELHVKNTYVEGEIRKIKDPNNLKIQTFLNNKKVQDFNTSDMIFKVNEIVSFISSVMTLYPGDIILTGTGVGPSRIKSGDRVNIDIENIGVLSNRVI